MQTIYTLCVGLGADAGDWPELGEWYHSLSLEALLGIAASLGLDTSVWRDIDGNPAPAGQRFDPHSGYNCLAYVDDKDDTPDSCARVHMEDLDV